MTLRLIVARPDKGDDRYIFQIQVEYPDRATKLFRIGIEKTNFPIRHAPIWDTYYPLMFITRNGGPLFKSEHASAVVSFEYDASRATVHYFQKRAKSFGLTLEVSSPLADIAVAAETKGELLLFGGGKDSRLILGLLRELGRSPAVVSANGGRYAPDIQGALVYSAISSSMADRIVPGLMMLPRTVYHGSGLGEVHRSSPWHQYFDISAPLALQQTSEFFRSVGLDISFQVPLVVLPYNAIQKVLSDRYRDLAAHQLSVQRNSYENKTLHVALLKLYHGLDYEDCCSANVLVDLARRWISAATNGTSSLWGYRRNYEIIGREICALLFRLSAAGRLPLQVPPDWDEDWIDSIHSYTNPDIGEHFLSIFREYAELLDPAGSKLPSGLRAYVTGEIPAV